MSARLALGLSTAALVFSLISLALYAAIAYAHAPVPLPPRALGPLGLAGMTWPLWAYATAVYRRAVAGE